MWHFEGQCNSLWIYLFFLFCFVLFLSYTWQCSELCTEESLLVDHVPCRVPGIEPSASCKANAYWQCFRSGPSCNNLFTIFLLLLERFLHWCWRPPGIGGIRSRTVPEIELCVLDMCSSPLNYLTGPFYDFFNLFLSSTEIPRGYSWLCAPEWHLVVLGGFCGVLGLWNQHWCDVGHVPYPCACLSRM